MDTIPKRKIRDVVAAQLKDHITRNSLRPGAPLPTEAELAAQFGVSRLSIREATKSLEYLGLVTSKPGKGLSVGQVKLELLADLLQLHPALQNASSVQLIESRVVIETGVLPHVANSIESNVGVYDSLKEINDHLRNTRNLQQWIDLDVKFHRQLVQASGLSPLLAFNDLLSVFFHKFRESVQQAEWKEGVESHQRLIDALKQNRLDAANGELRLHILSHKGRI